MSLASDILANSADALAVVHDDALVLMPANVPVTGYAEDVGRDTKTGQRLTTADMPFTHAIHIRRSLLANVTLNRVSTITAGARVYRVKNFVNDPGSPEIEFRCVLA